MMKYYMQMIFLSLLILLPYRIYAQSTFNCGDVSFNEEAVNEQYRIMLGRNVSSIDEVNQYAEVALSGLQISYYEPYNSDAGITQSVTCTSWVGVCGEVQNLSIPMYNYNEFVDRGGGYSVDMTGLIRSIWCELPNITTSYYWTNKFLEYNRNYENYTNGEYIAAQIIAKELTALAPNSSKVCAGIFDDIWMRDFGIPPPNITTCNPRSQYPPTVPQNPFNPVCLWFWLYVNGSMLTTDIIHNTRSLTQFIEVNEAQTCLQEYPLPQYLFKYPQYDPHTIGEYITQIYRLILGTRPSSAELYSWVNMYTNGTTQPILLNVANTLCVTPQPSVNKNNSKILGIALGLVFGVLIILGVWRWYHLQNQKMHSIDLKTSVLVESGNPIIHRIGV